MKMRKKMSKKTPKNAKILVADRIKQADAAKILKCSRQRISERIERGSLKALVVKDALDNETTFVSLEQVQELKKNLDREPTPRNS